MTDIEIIKALECCGKGFGDCDGCPYAYDDCITKEGKTLLMQDCIDLINRQKAEIERLKEKNGTLLSDIIFTPEERAMTIISAIKEFAERLKTKVDIDLCEAINCSDYLQDDLPRIIDNLVKEMAGAQNE